ncbi:hypothetical protein [Azospirillum soli]|uniref:hypothetical protein n=1 Tax=Azospirillum soli TaxID=1304799 RepID=UPI001AE555AD|nr:hypothetical protein [Azospirillum soli]MBP2314660.1 apolipoprotein N-acyltransferase [Azospirillum soli]
MATASSAMVFENPTTGQKEAVSNRDGVRAFLTGPFYFASKSLWLHAAIHAVLSIVGLLLWPSGALMVVGVWFGYAFATPTILEYRYQKLGWQKVSG